jgi:hypothetical protein
VIFQRLETAEQFCNSTVRALPHVRCEIYDGTDWLILRWPS